MSNKLDAIRPVSAMHVESNDPVISQFLNFDSVFGKDSFRDSISPEELESRRKSRALQSMLPDVKSLPMAEFNAADLQGYPTHAQVDTKSSGKRNARIERDDTPSL